MVPLTCGLGTSLEHPFETRSSKSNFVVTNAKIELVVDGNQFHRSLSKDMCSGRPVATVNSHISVGYHFGVTCCYNIYYQHYSFFTK
jgi:hypothetical protein